MEKLQGFARKLWVEKTSFVRRNIFHGTLWIISPCKNPLHESLEIPDDGNFDYPELKAIVKEVNSTQVLPAERLSDEVYRYDSKDKVFEKVATFETRQKEKASVKPNKAEHDQPQKATKKHKSNDMLF